MFHVDIILIATCFGCTLYHFYAFSGTNLLIRCHSASSLFSAVFRFRNRSESDEINYTVNKRSGRSRSPEGTWGGTPGAHAIGGRGQGGTRVATWCGGLVALLWLFFGLRGCIGENRSVGFRFVQFREYFQNKFSEIQKQHKTENGTVASC